MKRALLKDSVKEIKNTYKRFISILLMAFLGVGFFAGIRATSPDMVDTIDKYYDTQNVYDIQVISTLGLTEKDLAEIKKIENVEQASGSYEIDGKIEVNDEELVTKFIAIDEINKPVLLDGDLPKNSNECLVETSFLKFTDKKIGDIVNVDIENSTNDDGEEIAYLNESELKIVGTVQSPLYVSRDRGTSKLGAGKVNYYMYISKDNINAKDIYTNIYVTAKDAKEYKTSSEKYEEYIESVKSNIENIKEKREQARHDELVENANKKVLEAEDELNKKKEEGQQELKNAENKIEDARTKIQSGENQINANKQKADKEFANAKKQIDTAKAQIEAGKQELNTKEVEAENQFTELEKQKQELQSNLEQVNIGVQVIQESYNYLLSLLNNPDLSEQEKVQYEIQKQALESKLAEINVNKLSIEAGIKQIDDGIEKGRKELDEAKKQLELSNTEIVNKENQLNQTKRQTYAKIQNARDELEKSKQELKQGEEELAKNQHEFDEKIADAEKQLTDSKEKILEIENATWYILDRNANAGYVSFIQDTESIANIGKVFPVVFFIVATLISLTSMTRMVEEQRMQIGTLKALGYNKAQIMSKYVIYAGLACIIGSFLGMCVGFVLIPKVIWLMYGMMYQISEISLNFNLQYGLMGLILICVCIVGATIYTVLKEVVNEPAVLMRPKAPKMGNRVLLEKIPFIWKRLNFIQKVTVRNIFRYKKRFYMTIIGILGCTALILTGFGLKDSVLKIIPNQFEKVFEYDMQISLKDSIENNTKEEFIKSLKEKNEIERVGKFYMTSAKVLNGDLSEDVQIMVPETEADLEQIINIKDIKNNEIVKLQDNEICLTDKAGQLLNVKEGDTITLDDGDKNEIKVKISNIVENYVAHYVVMNKTTYENLYKKDYKVNVLLTKNKELDEIAQEQLAATLMKENEVSGVVNIESSIRSINDMMSLLNYVVIVLIVSAGLLAFVVLYNLANVNISERIRELATIKVLGFYDNEVYDYVTRETIILTVIGIALGLVGGYFLNYYIMGTCEINMLRFDKAIKPISYVYSVLITIIFTIIVNVAVYFSLKKIDMIESLKSVE